MQPGEEVDTAVHESGLPVTAHDGSKFELLSRCRADAHDLIYWMPALGVAAKHYLPLADALAEQGVAMVIHEWRGIGSSDQRAGRRVDWRYKELLTLDMPAGLAATGRQWPSARLWLGGHSLGGQLAAIYGGLHTERFSGLLLAASGAPYWRQYPHGWAIGLSYIAAPWLARLAGYFPGRRLGFGGNEARGVIDDWARTGRTGRYSARGMDHDLDARMACARWPVLALRMRDDWMVPQASLDWLLGKMPAAAHTQVVLGDEELGTRADHFSWMRRPRSVAAHMLRWIGERS